MYLHALGKILLSIRCLPPKTALVMKLILILTITACLQVTAGTQAQTITLSLKNAPFETVLKEIKKQSSYTFVYTKEELRNTFPITIHVEHKSITDVLDICFKDQPISYTLLDHFIIIKKKEIPHDKQPGLLPADISGHVINYNGEPVPAASIVSKQSGKSVFTDEQGFFTLKGVEENEVLIISSIGYETVEVPLNSKTKFQIRLRVAVNSLDETVIKGYYRTSQRLNTGSVSKITAEEISRQPVSNPLAALSGRVPGLIITQTNGVPGSGIKVQLRGQSSIGSQPGLLPLNDPLIIINGVPLANNNNSISSLVSARGNGGLSPLNLINPHDIESIEVLKDADATAIYGSRGANGVILITTKRGFTGKTKVSVNVYSGVMHITKSMDLMNTRQYVTMRNEAFKNDGLVPSVTSAPDLLSWDTARYTDWKKQFIRNTAAVINAELSLSAGNANTQFLLGAGYNRQTTAFPGSFADDRASLNLDVHHTSENQRLKSSVSILYSHYESNLPVVDLTSGSRLAPNAPPLFDSAGSLNWRDNGAFFSNPLAAMLQPYHSSVDNLVGNLQLSYQLITGLTLRSNFGYNKIWGNEMLLFPITSTNPDLQSTGSANFGDRSTNSWIIEPQLEYQTKLGKSKISALLGSSWQENLSQGSRQFGSGYINDAYIRSLTAAPTISATNDKTLYRYSAFFGRIGYTWAEKYLVNFTGRRDGSSRFGPGKQFGNFGAVGAAWIISNEKFSKRVPIISFAKVRGSYGITGNDQIGDYRYYDLWSFITGVASPYQGVPGVIPTRLFNADFSWETNKKLEGALDLGFMKDKILLSLVYFRNRSGNQLISYTLPIQTGFSSIDAKNFPALVENSGFEIGINTQNISSTNWRWRTSFNLTIPRNKLVDFPNIESTPYANTLTVGQPITTVKLYRFLGVDPGTGLYKVEDVNKDGAITNADLVTGRDITPKAYGGIGNTISLKGWELFFLIEGRKQTGINYLSSIYTDNMPGFSPSNLWSNQPVVVLNRWQKPGDNTSIQKFSRGGGPAFNAIPNFTSSDGIYSDASFIRLKTLSMSFRLPQRLADKLHMADVRVYFQGQNILSITNYEGSDPETQNVFALPPLRTLTAGIHVQL